MISLEKLDEVSVRCRSARKRRYKTQLGKMRQYERKKQWEEEIINLTSDIDERKAILSGYEKEFEKISQKHHKISQTISEVSRKEWDKHRWDYPKYEDWTYPEEIKIKEDLGTGGELYKEYRTAYDNYYLSKQRIESLEEELISLKKGEKKKGMFESEEEIAEVMSEIVRLEKSIKMYKAKGIDPDYIKAKEDRLFKLEVKYHKLTK